MPSIKTASYNLRMENHHDGKNMFTYRTPLIKDVIRRESPDIVGFQEVLPHMLDWLIKTFPEYVVVGCGRGSDYTDEANPVMFKKDLFNFLGYDMFWLSETPNIPGSRYAEQSPCPRICVVITLKHKDSPHPFRFYNTHLDHESDTARKLGMTAILKRMEEDKKRLDVPHILVGDMNAYPNSETIRYIRECKTRDFIDLTEAISGTYHGYGKVADKIDYIFSDAGTKYADARAWTDEVGGVYLSDHYPVSAVIELE